VPIIGLLSDSHGRAATTARAVELLLGRGAAMLLHLGDIETEQVLDALVVADGGGRQVEARLVFGNCDWNSRALARYAEALGLYVDDPVGRLAFGGRTLVFQHGHQRAAMEQALADGVTWLCHGHSHERRDERARRTRVLNPGALFRAAEYSVATLDTDADAVAFYSVPKG